MAGRAREIQVIFRVNEQERLLENGADGCAEHAGIPAQDGD